MIGLQREKQRRKRGEVREKQGYGKIYNHLNFYVIKNCVYIFTYV